MFERGRVWTILVWECWFIRTLTEIDDGEIKVYGRIKKDPPVYPADGSLPWTADSPDVLADLEFLEEPEKREDLVKILQRWLLLWIRGILDSSSQIAALPSIFWLVIRMRSWRIWPWSLMALLVFLPKRNTWSVSCIEKVWRLLSGLCQPKSLSSSFSWGAISIRQAWIFEKASRGLSRSSLTISLMQKQKMPLDGF